MASHLGGLETVGGGGDIQLDLSFHPLFPQALAEHPQGAGPLPSAVEEAQEDSTPSWTCASLRTTPGYLLTLPSAAGT